MTSHLKNQRGRISFIELLIIIVILGILAAVAIPKFHDITTEAKIKECRDALGSMRANITIFYANQAVKTGAARWPTYEELVTPGVVMAGSIPSNPFQDVNSAPDSIVIGKTTGDLAGERGGWVYNPETGSVWPNTNTFRENKF